jgi:hypothetical protein
VNTANAGNEIASCCHTSSDSHHRTIPGGGVGACFMLVILLCAAGCDPLQGSGTGTPPDPSKYIQVDDSSRSIVVTLIAGYPATDFQFNYNGYADGALVLTVPIGWQVTIQCENRGTVPNSCAVVAGRTDTAPGQSASFSFSPLGPGSFRIASLVDGHEASGMWADLEVVSSGRPALTAES